MTEAAFRIGDFDAAEATLRAALEQARADGDRRVEAAALDRLGMLTHFRALDTGLRTTDADAEEALFQQALAIRRDLDDAAGIAESLFGVGLVHQVIRRDWAAALPYFREAMALAEEHGDPLTRSEVHRHIGFFHLVEDGDLERAHHHLRVSLDLRERHGDPRWLPGGTVALGQVEMAAGRHAEAVDLLRRAVRETRAADLSQRHTDRAEEWLRRAEAGETPAFR
jgi:tetratricopeptide (TPR) repeat protein